MQKQFFESLKSGFADKTDLEAKETAITKGFFGHPTISPANFIDSQEELNLVEELSKIENENDAIPPVRTFIANYQEWAIFAIQHRRKSHNEDRLHHKTRFNNFNLQF